MFSSVGQIVGLIEIEVAESEAAPVTLTEIDCELGSDAEDASLDELLARLAGRPFDHARQASRTISLTTRPTSRLPSSAPRAIAVSLLGADLARLETDLADEAHRLRMQLASAGARGLAR